ncbi:aspartate/glutamate racemase family protein [soil metagenome]
MHIGLIGGIGPAATDFYHRGLIERHAASGIPLDLTIAYADVRVMSRNLNDKRPDRQAEIFARLVDRLKAAGAATAAVTSMGGHFCVQELEAISSLPILNGLPAVDAAIVAGKFRKVGIIGTRTVMDSKLYGRISSAEVVAPHGEERDRVHQDYVDMATVGHVNESQRRTFFEAGRRLCREQGVEAVMLGGTDLFLAFVGQDCGFPLIDCADLHVEALYRKSSSAA